MFHFFFSNFGNVGSTFHMRKLRLAVENESWNFHEQVKFFMLYALLIQNKLNVSVIVSLSSLLRCIFAGGGIRETLASIFVVFSISNL